MVHSSSTSSYSSEILRANSAGNRSYVRIPAFFLLLLGTPRPKCCTINTNQRKSRWHQQDSHSEPPRDVLQDLSLSLVQWARMGSEADGTTTITTEGHEETFCKIRLSHWHTVYKDAGIIGSRAVGGSADRRESASTAT
jgi:hypothetical protein